MSESSDESVKGVIFETIVKKLLEKTNTKNVNQMENNLITMEG